MSRNAPKINDINSNLLSTNQNFASKCWTLAFKFYKDPRRPSFASPLASHPHGESARRLQILKFTLWNNIFGFFFSRLYFLGNPVTINTTVLGTYTYWCIDSTATHTRILIYIQTRMVLNKQLKHYIIEKSMHLIGHPMHVFPLWFLVFPNFCSCFYNPMEILYRLYFGQTENSAKSGIYTIITNMFLTWVFTEITSLSTLMYDTVEELFCKHYLYANRRIINILWRTIYAKRILSRWLSTMCA